MGDGSPEIDPPLTPPGRGTDKSPSAYLAVAISDPRLVSISVD
jgi:hypothetical protein